MATIEVEYHHGTMVYEVDAGAGRWLGAVDVKAYEGRYETTKSVVGFSTLDSGGAVRSVTYLSEEYQQGTFDGMDSADMWRFLNRNEGLLAVRLNGSIVWSLAAELAEKAREDAAKASDDERAAEADAQAEEEREFVRRWVDGHPDVTDVPSIAKQTGSSKALVRAVLLGS